MIDINSPNFLLGVVGAGWMGRGIAQLAAQAGLSVRLYDSRPEGALAACQALVDTFNGLVRKGRMETAARDTALGRLSVAGELAELASCQVVIEAIIEDLDAKRALFQQLEAIVAANCVLATNTSSLSVTAIAAGCSHPERVAGMHFFSPVPLMKVVEIIDSALGDPATADGLVALTQRLGHRPVRARDTPGFIVNHAGRAYGTEALRVLGEGVAEPADIDAILRHAGFRMGPFELFDLIGLDVSLPVMESIYQQYYQEPRYRPSPLLRQRCAAGLLGRKNGRGFYPYVDGQPCPHPTPATPATTGTPIWVSPSHPSRREHWLQRLRNHGSALDLGERPGRDSACVVLPVGLDATHAALAEQLDPRRTVAVNPLATSQCVEMMTTPITEPHWRDTVWAALGAGSQPVRVLHDSPGFVSQRVLAMIVNIGCDIAQQRIASPDDIDAAVQLGLGYPQGPLTLGDSLGASTVLTILDGLHALYRDPRYRPSPWLLRRARLGVSLTTPEA